MLLQMFINNLLVDAVTINYPAGLTVKEKECIVKRKKKDLTSDFFSRHSIHYQKPHFILLAHSKVNVVIQDDIENKLLVEFEQQLSKLKSNEDNRNNK